MSSRNLCKLYKKISNEKESVVHEHRSVSLSIYKKRIITTLITIKQWDVLAQVIMEKPDCAAKCVQVIEHGHRISRLPIHEVCRHKPPLELIRILVSAHPISLLMKDDHNGSTALHFACRFGASEEVIEYLLRKYPDAANVEDKYECVPVTLARRGSYKHKYVIVKLFDRLYLDEDEKQLCAGTRRHNSLGARTA